LELGPGRIEWEIKIPALAGEVLLELLSSSNEYWMFVIAFDLSEGHASRLIGWPEHRPDPIV